MRKLVVLLLVVPLFWSCGDDDNVKTSPYASKIVGKWIVTDLAPSSSSSWMNIERSGDDYMWAEFLYGGVYRSKDIEKNYAGTWTIDGNIVTVKVGNITIYYTIESLSEGVAVLKMRYEGKDGYMKLKAKKG